MFSEPYVVPNYVNFLFASNMPDPVHVPQDDRRFNVGDYQPEKLVITEKEIKEMYNELPQLFDYFMRYPADVTRANTILQTQSREHLQHLSLTAAGELAKTLIEGDFEDLWINKAEKSVQPVEIAYDQLLMELLREGTSRKVLTRDELLTLFRYRVGDVPESPNRFTSYLKHNRIYTARIRKGDKTHHGIYITWKQDQEWFDKLLKEQDKPVTTVRSIARAALKK
jgi:hypothetical protein